MARIKKKSNKMAKISALKRVFRERFSEGGGDSSTDKNADTAAPKSAWESNNSTDGARAHLTTRFSSVEGSSISTEIHDGTVTPLNANTDIAAAIGSDNSKPSPPPLTIASPSREQQMDLAYDTLIPTLPVHNLPRGGVSIQTQACGCVQFGIPPETIKDSMKLGLEVPSVYIVPVDRFCREMGPALGVNLAEFEFPAYFNFFIQRRRCTLVVDSVDAERNIRSVFSETLLGPAQFREPTKKSTEETGENITRSTPPSVNELGIKKYEEEDFAPDFPRDAIPDFYKELQHFRIMPNGQELVLETLLKFCHFESAPDSKFRDTLGSPPPSPMENGNISNKYTGGVMNITGNVDAADAAASNSKAKKKAPKTLTYNQIRWIGDVAKIYPSDAPPEQIAANKTKRVEIFKMPSGTDYVLHDIDENNIIIGKVRFSGNVQVSEGISVIGLDGEEQQSASLRQLKLETESTVSSSDGCDDDDVNNDSGSSITPFTAPVLPPTFHPPSFGVTVLGNSHGFDKSGSTSGYVLWINGRGVMIDPPPYSSATLEREGIRPRTIVGIILTHCHADHDAGAFQKVLTGSPVVVITTPTIYKSFIRKYAALSSLSPALLKHSHRYKPAVIGEPLRFQGATFHFTYTLHSIPCVGFRVDWRGRSMVFTGDHFNNPPALETLVEKGVLSKQRAADLNHLPLQETDLLLHEAGAPPIHTPLDVLLKLPLDVKKRLYVVHTSALPEGCELRVAPTGTAGTIRLDKIRRISESNHSLLQTDARRPSIFESIHKPSTHLFGLDHSLFEDADECGAEESELLYPTSKLYAHLSGGLKFGHAKPFQPPPVSLRPTSSSDAWFILNLLSEVPFVSSLSYSTTMEVLETARVVAYCCDEVVLAANRRNDYLVVVWEGTCVERERKFLSSSQQAEDGKVGRAVWYAGDWTGPWVLQPEKTLSGDSPRSETHDIVAMSSEGVKVIKVDIANLDRILKNGSALYRKYHLSLSQQHSCTIPSGISVKSNGVFEKAVKKLNIIELIDSNTALRKLTAVQKRHLECLVEGPTVYAPGQRLWRTGAVVDKAFIIIAGTVSFVPKRRHGGSSTGAKMGQNICRVKKKHETNVAQATEDLYRQSIGESMKSDAIRAVRELIATNDDGSDNNDLPLDSEIGGGESNSLSDCPIVVTDEYARLSRDLQKWAEHHQDQVVGPRNLRDSLSSSESPDVTLHDLCDADYGKIKHNEACFKGEESSKAKISSENQLKSTKDRFANKVLCRLSNKRSIASGLIFSRGHFLGDIAKMVEGLLSSSNEGELGEDSENGLTQFSFGDTEELSLDTMTLHELDRNHHTVHNSTLAAGKDGCVVMVLQKASLLPFLDAHPGLLLSLLGTQVVV